MKHFFRAIEDGVPLKLFSPVHLVLLAIYIIGIIFIAKKKFGLNDEKRNRKFLIVLASILLIDQIVLYAWQLGSGYFRMDISLPLYHCRLAVWMLIIGVLLDNRKIKVIGIYWGTMGSVMAMVMADLYKFQFPHYTNFQFFIVHIIMGWIIADLLFVTKDSITKEDNKFVVIFTNVYNVLLVAFNLLMVKSLPDINYGYMIGMPPFIGPIFSRPIHILVMLILFNIAMFGIYYLFRAVQRGEMNDKKVLK